MKDRRVPSLEHEKLWSDLHVGGYLTTYNVEINRLNFNVALFIHGIYPKHLDSGNYYMSKLKRKPHAHSLEPIITSLSWKSPVEMQGRRPSHFRSSQPLP
jgi:hypothetical protein